MFPEVQLGGSLQIDAPMLGPKQRTLSPAVTGGAILAVKVCYHCYVDMSLPHQKPPNASSGRPLRINFHLV